MTMTGVRSSGRPTPQEAEAVDETLMSAAFDEFAEHGYSGASLTRVVARARMSKTTLYSRYASKEALFKNLIWRQIGSQRPYDFLPLSPVSADIADDLEQFAIEALNFSFEPRMLALNRVIIAEVHRFPALAQAADEKVQRGILRVTRHLKARAAIAGATIKDAEAIGEAFIHMMRGWYLHRLFSGQPTNDEEVRIWARNAVRALIRPAPCW